MPRKRSNGEKSVVISLWSAGSCGRKQLEGILEYVNRRQCQWNMRIIMNPDELTADEIAREGRDGADGFIAFVNPEAAPALAASSVPTVLMSFPLPVFARRKTGLVKLVNNNDLIGRMGADYFLTLGVFASYAFVPDDQNRGWSRMRERAFCARLTERGIDCSVFGRPREELGDWLAGLPKPVAVMTPFDLRAKEVLTVCRARRLSVPNEVAILGVDDDSLICEMSRPSLSSIRLDQIAYGRKAAAMLDELMRARKDVPSRTQIVEPGQIVERESTRALPPAVLLSRRMQAFIESHATEGLSPDDVARAVGVSRRLADLRFRQTSGTTLRRAIEARQLAELKRLLRKTAIPIAKASLQCGFHSALWAKYVFKRNVGMTMSEWRRSGR